jgi:hypothetical protein
VVTSRFFAPAVVFGLFFLLAGPVLAQEATPAAAPAATAGEVDLAAMALSAEDLPPGYRRFWGGVLAPGEIYGDIFASHLSQERLAETGHIRSYEDDYGVWNSGEFMHIYIDEYATAEGAAKGFEIFEDEANVPPGDTVLSMEDRPLPGVGEEPSELTVGAVIYEDGTFSQSVGSAFRIGNLNAGVVLEYLSFPDESGTPVATPASAASPDPEQIRLVEEMSAKLAARIEAVLAGETPSGVDPELAAKVLPLQQFPHAWRGISWEGYEASETMIGFEGALTRFAPDYRSGFSRMIMMGTGDDFPPPYVSVGVSEFASPTAATDMLTAIRETPGDLPTPAVSPRGAKRELVDDPTIPGADAALAFRSALDEEDPEAPFDSAGVDFVVGPYLVTVDVQGVDSAEAAMAAAEDLAMQQAACLTAEGPCTAAAVPTLMAPSAAAPAAATPEG